MTHSNPNPYDLRAAAAERMEKQKRTLPKEVWLPLWIQYVSESMELEANL